MVFQHGDLAVHYTDRGEGAVVLLLHGWMGSRASFEGLANDLSGHVRTISLDFPGQGGKTPEPGTPFGVAEHMELVLALLRSLSIDKVSIVAHSFGGRISLKLASEHPEVVHRMVLTGCAGLRPKKTLKRRLRSLVYRAARRLIESPLYTEKRREALRERLIERFGSSDYKALAPSMRATFNRVVGEDLSYCLPKIGAPTVLVFGTEDTETPIWMGETMARAMKDAALIPFHGAGHFAYLEKYPDFLAIVSNFLLSTTTEETPN